MDAEAERPVRLFVAAELPTQVAEGLAWWARDVIGSDPAMRRLPVASLHLTLAFLDARPPAEVAAIGAALETAVAGSAWPVDLGLDDLLWLPARRPHALTMGVEDPRGALRGLQQAVVAALGEAIGFAAEGRPFLAHVTVARVRGGLRPRTLELPLPSPERFDLEAVTLMRSGSSDDGPVYTPLVRVVRP